MTMLSWIYLATVCLTLFIYLLNYRLKEPFVRWLTFYLFFVAICSLVAMYSAEVFGQENNLFLFHIFTPMEYMILAGLYYMSFETAFVKKLVVLSIPVFVLLSATLSAWVEPLDQNNSIAVIIESILIVSWSLLFLREIIVLGRAPRLQAFPMFWISIGLLFFFIGNLFVEGLMNYFMRESMHLALQAYKFSFIFKFLLFILMIIGIWSTRFPDGTRNEP